MPAYKTPTNPGAVPLAIFGKPFYSAGSFNSANPGARMQVTASAVASNVVTLTVTVLEGNIPAVGDTVYVTGTQNNAGALNSTAGVTLTAVNISTTTGQGTISYAATTANLSTTADTGLVQDPPAEVGDSLTTNAKFAQVAVQEPGGSNTNQKTVTWSTVIGGSPSGVTINLQASMVDIDSQYETLDSSTNTSGETRAYIGANFPFYRITAGTITGGSSPSLVGKILV